MNRILCLWFPRWPLERWQLSQPQPCPRVLLYEQTPHGGLRVVAATEPAVRPGMPLAEALALAQHGDRRASDSIRRESVPCTSCAALHLEAHDPWADRQALVELAESCRRYSPLVGIEDAPRPDCLLLDLTGLVDLYGGEERLVQQVLGELRARGFTVQAAVAGTVGAAWGLAHFGVSNYEGGLRMESDAAALCHLPLAALRLPDETLTLLARLGLHHVGQVEALPREALAPRFGPQLLRRLDQMFGRVPETLVAPRMAAEISAERSFESPREDRETIEAVCQTLVRQITPPLAARCEGAVQWECRFDCPPAEPVRVTVGLYRASASAEHLWEMLRLRLQRLRLPAAVTAIRVEVLATAPLAWQQRELFNSEVRHAPREAVLLIDRLSNRLGRQAVVRPVLVSDAQPEHACVYLPLAGETLRFAAAPTRGRRTRKPAAQTARSWSWPLRPEERPLCLQAHPQPLVQVRCDRHGAPHAFRWRGRLLRLASACGPERIETGWWRSGLVRRDYYRVQAHDGSRYWLFRDLRSKRWFLHGEFA